MIKKGIRNANIIVCKFILVLIKATNYRLKIASNEKQKREEMMERRKTKAIATKRQNTRRGISLSSEKKENYESDSKNESYIDQVNDKYLE